MNPLHTTLIMALSLAGCVSTDQQSPAALTTAAEYAVEKGYASKADILAALTAARRSKYFPGTERYQLGRVNPHEIEVLYYDMPGTCVLVKRIHGRWRVVSHTFWQS